MNSSNAADRESLRRGHDDATRYRVGSHMNISTTPLKVTIDVGPLYGHRTGIGVAVAGLVDTLSQRNDVDLDPYVVSFRSTPQAGHRRLPVPGIVASHVWSRASWPRFDRWAGDAQLVHGTNYVVPPTRMASLVSVYDCWFLRHPEQASSELRRAAERLRRAIEAGAHVHTSSESTAAQVREMFATDRVTTITLGLPPAPAALADLARPAIADELRGDAFILAVGTEERRKALPMLVGAFAAVAADQPRLRLVLVGAAGNDTDGVTRAIARLPGDIRGRVLRLGVVDDPVKHWLLRRASVLAYPSLDEGFGFPILEAQLAATPVVANDVGAVAEVGGDSVVRVASGDPSAFAEALARTVSDGGLRLGLIEAGHRNVRRFDWADTAQRMVDLYQRVYAEWGDRSE
jgi:glycosyltransferase involved in cell wall biosynthesis